MFSFEKNTWNDTENACSVALDTATTGLIAGTKVATPTGWRLVEAIAAGDKVLTFDGGMQTVVSVVRILIAAPDSGVQDVTMMVPTGALGNCEPMFMMSHQAVFVESDTAEVVFGDPFAMIPAAALEGFRGIEAVVAAPQTEVVTLQFARDEVVFANIGALFFCPRANDLLDDARAPAAYEVMTQETADVLIGFLEMEDQGYAPTLQAVAAFQTAA